MKNKFIHGLIDGIPIALGYLSVSFGIGIMATRAGISAFAAICMSFTNLTSAGQAAGITIIAAGGTLVEIALTQFVINLRYSLMGVSLTQKLDSSFTFVHRLICSFGITDEIFAVASTKKEDVCPSYMYGLIVTPIFGWTLGTALGAFMGQVLPASISAAMGILLYGMFIAIVVPAARENRGVLAASLIAIAFSVIFKYTLTFISSGFAIIISAVLAAAFAAAVSPVKDGDTQ